MNCLSKKSGLDEKGFSLLELIIAAALISIVAAGLITSYMGQQDAELSQEQIVDMQQHTRAGIHIMVMNIRMAGYDPYSGKYEASIKNAGTGLNLGEALIFTYVADDDGIDNAEYNTATNSIDGPDGEVDEEGETKTLAFYLYDAYGDGDSDLGMRVGNSAVGSIAENIVNVADPADPSYIADSTDAAYISMHVFTYLDGNGAVIANPQNNLNNIRAVEIRLTARVDTGETDHTVQNATRTVRTIVECRNLNI